jgi:uncharacterized protein
MAEARRDWIQTYSGKRFDYLSPRLMDVDIDTVAHALALIPRWGAQLPHAYSVAQHSLLVKGIVQAAGGSTELQWEALLHDAAEAYTGDMPRPWKRLLQRVPEVKVILDRIEQTVASAFNLSVPKSAVVENADQVALYVEWRDLSRRKAIDDWIEEYRVERRGVAVETVLDAETAEEEFLDTYYELRNGLQ